MIPTLQKGQVGRYILRVSAKTLSYFTSWLYPISNTDDIDISGEFVFGSTYNWDTGEIDIIESFVSGVLHTVLITYNNWTPEEIDITDAFVSGTLVQYYFTVYSNWPPEEMDISHTFVSGVLHLVVLTYSYYAPEEMDISGSFVSGVLA
jgi:hypothetical protein